MDLSGIPQLINGWGVVAFVSLIAFEIFLSLKYEPELYQWKDFGGSVFMGFGSVIVAIGTKALTIWAFFLVYNFFNPTITGEGANVAFGTNYTLLPDWQNRVNIFGWHAFGFAWYMFLICQVLDDFNYYWHHRLSHTVRVMWAAHIVHHSSNNFNLGSGIRNGWVTLLYKPLFWMWLPAIGFHPYMVLICLAIQSLWQFQLHTKFVPYMGFLEKFLNTHKQHQVHHAQNVEYMDKNHGGYLNIFDRLFGTHEVLQEETVDIKFGVVHPPKTNHPIDILTHEYRDIWRDVKSTPKLKHKLMYIFGPPGWMPGDSSQTVRNMQREIKKRKREEQRNAKMPVAV
jgi:sterol desaturase/sphingolipid hydroxylase (fatty acid hydroxylase superfamily)